MTDQSKLTRVRMPQIYLSGVTPGMMVDFSVPEYLTQLHLRLMASAGAVAAASGTQLLQFQIDNSQGTIKPGDYAEMHFKFPATAGVMRVPATALLFRDEGMMGRGTKHAQPCQDQARRDPHRSWRLCGSKLALTPTIG